MIGRADCLETQDAIRHWKSDGLDLTSDSAACRPNPMSGSMSAARVNKITGFRKALALDNRLVDLAGPALQFGEPVEAELQIVNTHRTVGAILSHNIAKRFGARTDCPTTAFVSAFTDRPVRVSAPSWPRE